MDVDGWIVRVLVHAGKRRFVPHLPIAVEVEPAPFRRAESAFEIATFNVRCPFDGGELRRRRRMPRVAEIVKRHGFDVFGVQEATPGEVKLLEWELPAFAHVGCVFATGDVRVLDHETITDRPEGQFASDHFPVAATVEFR